jgi:hypothetical protein
MASPNARVALRPDLSLPVGHHSIGFCTFHLAIKRQSSNSVLSPREARQHGGIDIRLLPHVVNYELPNVPEDYVHRIGRTGRAGEEGCACSLVSADERGLLKDIEKVLKRPIPVQNIEGFEMAEIDGLEDARNTSRGNQGRGRSQGGGGGVE